MGGILQHSRSVQHATLKDRDQIQAGQTVIEIRMEDITHIRQQVLAHFKRQPKPFYAIVIKVLSRCQPT